jgi:4-amino-4-deoxy-L-arabinose transferase-like glycosyltransferase
VSLRRVPWVELVGLVIGAVFLLATAPRVPFHPDETSWLVQSGDLEGWIRSPLSLAWTRSTPPSAALTYRLLNAPLAKDILGIAREVAGYPSRAIPVDWDWTRSWEENVAAGALPPTRMLAAGRIASALLLLPAVAALYLCGVALGGRKTGLAAAVLLASNALILLHGRRSMAEGALTLGVTLALLGLLHADRHPWLAGAAAGIAFAAKTSAAIWVPLGWIGAAWPESVSAKGAPRLAGRLAAFTAAAALTVLALYPVLWREPFGAVTAMVRARQSLVQSQVETFGQAMPWAVLSTPGDRLVSLLAQVYIAPPQFAEASNYAANTAASEAAYLRLPGTDLMRGFAGGAIVFVATVLGMVFALRYGWRRGRGTRRRIALTLLATLAQGVALLVAVPLSFQRYVIPMVPLVCLWAGYGIAHLIDAAKQNRRARTGPAADTVG